MGQRYDVLIPCKYSDKSPIVQCVASIRKHYPDDLIAVVDSDSDDKSYFESLEKYGVVIEDIQNKNFLKVLCGTALKNIR